MLLNCHVTYCSITDTEVCHDGSSEPYCAMISDGGCPCANSDEIKCGASKYSSGYCSRACCDWTVEEACFDDNNELLGCARLDQGGCRNDRQRKIASWPEPAPQQTSGMRPSPSLTSPDRAMRPSPSPSSSAPQENQKTGMRPRPMGMRPRPSTILQTSSLSQI